MHAYVRMHNVYARMAVPSAECRVSAVCLFVPLACSCQTWVLTTCPCPQGDANDRKWELRAGNQQDALDWINALRRAYSVAEEAQAAAHSRRTTDASSGEAKPALHASL